MKITCQTCVRDRGNNHACDKCALYYSGRGCQWLPIRSARDLDRIAELEAENERWTLECRELHRTIAKVHEEYRPEVKDAERLGWAKNNPRQFYEICQETLMSNVDEDVAIDAAMKGEL